ncbi:hypothetical protein AUP74_01817 [Microbulbifer aggregans]|uniref:Uncharacterized protein n=1 Tax=Microbulbifer aggregans TaxID=1769779 RepID=A0A1C9W7Y8_9GAMM|nr:hypothetical protein [Microbulbifer aggregans]AOS97248.1 hypothetical protein AUP74_01817 [Microbulbifer aggregans]
MAQRLYIASDQLMVFHLQNVLEQAGISALMQKAAVDVPQEEGAPLAWYSELWVLQDGQLAAAHRLLEQFLASEVPDEPVGLTSLHKRPPCPPSAFSAEIA